MSAPTGTWRVERHTDLDAERSEAFFALYERAFSGLRVRAAARHLLTAEEFGEEMRDPRIDKYVAVSEDGVARGLTTLTTDLAAVPWISPDFYAHRWPEHASRGAVHYLGLTLCDPAYQRAGVFEAMLDTVVARLLAEDAVCVWDMCDHNVETSGLADAIAGMVAARSTARPEVVDTQRYFAADFTGARR